VTTADFGEEEATARTAANDIWERVFVIKKSRDDKHKETLIIIMMIKNGKISQMKKMHINGNSELWGSVIAS